MKVLILTIAILTLIIYGFLTLSGFVGGLLDKSTKTYIKANGAVGPLVFYGLPTFLAIYAILEQF